jgi:glucose/arabinose dehydrogenase
MATGIPGAIIAAIGVYVAMRPPAHTASPRTPVVVSHGRTTHASPPRAAETTGAAQTSAADRGTDPGAAAADPAATPAPKLSADERATHAVVDAYRAAIESADTSRMRAVYPRMPQSQMDFWQKNFFAVGRNIHASVSYTTTKVAGRTADVDYVMRLRYDYRTGAPGSARLRYHALLTKTGARWHLTELKFQ